MAHAGPFPDEEDEEDQQINCSICLSEMENPKALPCLHSFCLTCLREYAKGISPPCVIKCPLCQEEIVLPPGGVDAFRDNFYINQMKERRAILTIHRVKQSCKSCGSTDREMVAKCIDCDGFICQQCDDSHKSLVALKNHTVYTIEDLRSGKVDITKVMKEECCLLHKDQVLRWFCKTCQTPICLACTVMDHRHPEHDYVTLESATEGQMAEIHQSVANCKGISQRIDAALINAKKEPKSSLAESRAQLDGTKEQVKREFLNALEENYESNKEKLNKIETDRCDQIDNDMKALQNTQSRLTHAITVANALTRQDVAYKYSTLTKTLTQLKDKQVCHVSESLSRVRFRPKQKSMVQSVDLGTVLSGRSGGGKWVMEKEIGKDGDGKIQYGRGVAISPNRDIVIADYCGTNVKVFDYDGKLKQVLGQGSLVCPWDVTMSSTGHYYVTDLSSPQVKVYQPNGKYVKQFPIQSPSGTSPVTDKSGLCGIDMDEQGHLWIGSNKRYISKHQQDGKFISAIKVGIHPLFIAVTANRVIVSPNSRDTGVHVLDHTGNHLHTISAPDDATSWYPTGVCCSTDDDIYISSFDFGDRGGIYNFTMDGKYKACITTDLTCANGLALIDDDTLVVAQGWGLPARVFTCTHDYD